MEMKKKCIYCKHTLVKVGQNRANGIGYDFDGRQLHRNCANKVFTIRDAYCITINNVSDTTIRIKFTRKLVKHCNKYGISYDEPVLTYEEQRMLLNL